MRRLKEILRKTAILALIYIFFALMNWSWIPVEWNFMAKVVLGLVFIIFIIDEL